MNIAAAGLALGLTIFAADSHNVGRWELSPPSDPSSGSCLMLATDQGIGYGFSFRQVEGDRLVLDLWLANTDWDFTVGEIKYVRVEMGGLGGTMKAEAIASNTLDIAIEATKSVVLAAMLAPTMTVQTGRGTVILSLEGSRLAMEELRNCTQRFQRGNIGAYGGQLF